MREHRVERPQGARYPPLPYLLTLSFVITYAALHFILFAPLQRYLSERDATVTRARAEAKDLAEEIEARLSQVKDRLRGAKQEAAELRAQGRERAAAAEAQILGEAREASAALSAPAAAAGVAAAGAAAPALRKSVDDLAGDIVRQVLDRPLEA